MKVTLRKICGDLELTIEAEGKDEKEIWPQLEFWTALPTAHPSGATDFQIKTRPAVTNAGKTVHYYEIACLSTGQRFCLGQSTEGGLFPKGWEHLPGGQGDQKKDGQTKSATAPATSRAGNVSTFKPKPLTEDELKFRAQRLVTEGRVTFDAASKTYTVQVNDKISYQVKPGPTCDCERFRAAPESNFRCEHIRAVALFTSGPLKPAQRDELKLLVADLLEAGVPDTEIDAAIAKVCDGLYVVEELSPEQIAKAIRTLQGKLNVLAVTRYSEVA